MTHRFFSALALGTTLFVGALTVALPTAHAQVTSGLNAVGETIKLPGTDPRIIATNIINVALGLIGIVLVVLILYGGFIYMTSGGEAEKVSQARKIITNAIIGLVIVLSSWAIARFVIDRLLAATQGGGGGVVSTGGGGGGGGFGGGGGSSAFRVKSISPAGAVSIRNIQVSIVFTRAVDTAGTSGIVVMKDGGATVAGTVDVAGSVVTFTPTAACPAPNADRHCFDANTNYVVKVGGSVRSSAGQPVSCSGFGAICEGTFKSGSIVDTKPPTVKFTFPTDGMSVRANSVQKLAADATDDAGIATVEFFDGSSSIGVDGPTGSLSPLTFSAAADWLPSSASLGPHTLSAGSKDIATNVSPRSSISVVVRAEHCFNGKQDSPSETGIDCGGDSSSLEYCGACAGGSCTKSSDCSSGACVAGLCVVQPVISSVSPLSGKTGTIVTISGTNFGSGAGTVTFLGGAGAGDDKIAVAPKACTDAGTVTWTNTQVIVAVPDGASSGPIELKNAASGLTDATNDSKGPSVPNYVVDGTDVPGLCAVVPSAETVGSYVEAVGAGFGSTAGKILFAAAGGPTEASVDTWSPTRVRFRVPVANTGLQDVSVKIASAESNAVAFTVLEKVLTGPPSISSIDPGEAPRTQTITIFGTNFGSSLGKVIFKAADGTEALGDTSFPSACTVAGYWRDDRITIKVPSVFKSGTPTASGKFQVRVERPDSAVSNEMGFTINTALKPAPGICAITPSVGPRGTPVSVLGEGFGAEKPAVTFYLGKPASVDTNTDQRVTTKVPDGAITGPVTLAAGGAVSNKVNFDVRNCNESPGACVSGKEQCCPTGECRPIGDACGVKAVSAAYAWQSSTGLIPVSPRVIEECGTSGTPSPSPWSGRAGGDNAPVDATIYMRFSRTLDPSSVLLSSFRVSKCTSKSTEPCATTEKTDVALSSGVEGTDQYLVELTPSKPLETSTTYDVKVRSSIKAGGSDGATMEVNKSCGTGPGGETYGYCFRFKTRASTAPSTVGSVRVAPATYVMTSGGETAPAKAVPLSAEDRCVVLNCRAYDWDWYTGTKKSPDARADVTRADKPFGTGKCEQVMTAIADTASVPVKINAEISGTGPAGSGDLTINFLPPSVEAFAPNCDQACSNAQVWALFTSELDPTSVTAPGNVEIRQCKNENCNEDELSSPLALGSKAIKLVPPFKSAAGSPKRLLTVDTVETGKSLLAPGGYYRVLLKGGAAVPDGIRGKNGVALTGTNHPQGYQWTFRVKVGADASCKADRVDVVPAEKYESTIGARQLFTATAFGKADACSLTGQAITPLTPADWKTGDPKVADMYKIGGTLVDTGAELPAGCTGSCLATGASAQYGKVAVCGNGVIETTDPLYCDTVKSIVPAGKCMTMPSGAQAGEECEPSLQGAVCNPNTCLFLPVKPVTQSGGTCGNGTVEITQGEICDPGLRCVGGSKGTPPVAELSLCNTDALKVACATAGGTCGVQTYRGCTANCRHTGASAAGSTCGVSDPKGDGKDCDDGNRADGDGCSSQCLHEGSLPATVLPSVCGNAILEPGETCERPSVSAPWSSVPGCNPKTCLHTGVLACSSSGEKNCCGDGNPNEPGKDCDDGNSKSGDGCSSSCLLEGSSVSYSTSKGDLAPSFCSNGVLEAGEQCEAGAPSNEVISKGRGAFTTPKGDGLADPAQLAYIVGDKVPDDSGILATNLSVTLEGQTGTAKYGLQCGLTDESACGDPNRGLDQYGCCAPRPQVDFKYPKPGDTGVCRNVLLQAGFNTSMDVSSAVNNFEISENVAPTSACPAGTTEILAVAPAVHGVVDWLRSLWHRFVAFATGSPAYADRWCKGNITGQLVPIGSTTTKMFAFNLDRPFAANTKVRVRFIGDTSASPDPLADNADPAKRVGVKTARGVVRANSNSDASGPLIWTFTTGDKVCNVNAITISDTTAEPPLPARPHPFLFTNAGASPETRDFSALAASVQSGVAVPLSSTGDYDWSWGPWTVGDTDIFENPVKKTSPSEASMTSKRINGSSVLGITVEITKDTVNVPSTTKSIVAGIAPVSVLACQNPWPQGAAPFKDAKDSKNFADGDPFFKGPFYNFSTMYCRDAGVQGNPDDDLPSLTINQIPPTILDYSQGILRQYLFSYPDESKIPKAYQGQGLKQDGVGIRIVANPQHLSPEEWYLSRGFTGSPKARLVDGYPAIEDGSTVYVAGTNRPNGDSGAIYSNVYILSYNPDAKPVTKQIANQLVQYLALNVNNEFTKQTNVCVDGAGKPFTSDSVNGGAPIHCLADWECLQIDPSTHCDSTKAKIIRDTLRVADFQYMSRVLETKKDPQGKYPRLSGGTYLQTLSNSQWSSWQKELGAAAGVTLPVDPLNRFLTCGECSKTNAPCQKDADCPVASGAKQTCLGGKYDGIKWVSDDAIDPQTCWNKKTSAFLCPQIPTAGAYGVSRIYRYQSLSTGLRYDLGAEFEVPPEAGKLSEWWTPPLAQGAFRCANPPVVGQYCTDGAGAPNDAWCRPCPNGNCNKCKGGTFDGSFCASDASCGGASCTGDKDIPVVTGSCRQSGASFTYSGICRNTSVGDAGRCGDGIVNPGETCDAGMTQLAACATSAGAKGHKKQICDLKDCKRFIDDPLQPQCVADAACGNGRIDRRCAASGEACLTTADCSTGDSCVPAEACDDGSLNGSYGHCNTTCTGFGAYCGDGKLSPGEVCDLGTANGDYCPLTKSECFDPSKSCSTDCRSIGPYCGDGIVGGPEECDGNAETTQSAICSGGDVSVIGKKTCATDADCGSGGTCGLTDPSYKSCVGVKATDPKTGTAYDTQHTRSCRAPGDSLQCRWDSWSACLPKGSCGDGIKDPGEECDNGSANGDTKACTSQCKKNVCGDGKVNVGVEECDNGADNGKVTCSADYGSMCLSCSTSCKFAATAGGFCGDGMKNGPEQCDGTDGITGALTCTGLGFDYGVQSVKEAAVKTSASCLFLPNNYGCLGSLCDEMNKKISRYSCTSDADCELSNGARGYYPFLAAGTISDFFTKSGYPIFSCSKDTSKECSSDADCGKDGPCEGYLAVGRCMSDIPSCKSTCGYGGCARCTDTITDPTLSGSINGSVRDAFDPSQPVPGARVTLLYRGVKVAEASTGDSGGFSFTDVNLHPACDTYRVIVDFYGDNPRTPYLDESVNGGYLPYTSDPFSAATFWSVGLKNSSGVITLIPRGKKGDTYVITSWDGAAPFQSHVVVPLGLAFTATEAADSSKICNGEINCVYKSCSGKDCHRDVNGYQPGVPNTDKKPYAYLGYDRRSKMCENAPQVMRFTRKYAVGGEYHYYVEWASSGIQDFRKYHAKVQVLTDTDAKVFFAPVPGTGGENYWDVFTQDALDGTVKETNKMTTGDTTLETGPAPLLCGLTSSPSPPPPPPSSPSSPPVTPIVVPLVSSYSPKSVSAGSAAFELTIFGAQFNPDAKVKWGVTTFLTAVVLDSKTIKATVPASLLTKAGSAFFDVENPYPSGTGVSGGQPFTITP